MTDATTAADGRHMAAALALSARHLGRTWPNPSVGCVLVQEGRVVGRAVTAVGGRPHAEALALERAGAAAAGAVAYVTLEPCAHDGDLRHRRGPSCAQALAAAGVARVVAPFADPDPRTASAGFRRLREAGVEVAVGCMAEEAERLHAGFLSRLARGRPLVTLKVAASLDGRVATAKGASRWITGEASRRQGHALRAGHDAVMVGSGTVLADDPALTCRLEGLAAASPVRVVADGRLRLPEDAKLVRTAAQVESWVLTGRDAPGERRRRLRSRGVAVLEVARGRCGRLCPEAMLRALGERGITRLLVEGGPALATALLRASLVDRMAWFTAPRAMGGDGIAALAALGVDSLDALAPWRVVERLACGEDGVAMLEAA